MLSLSISAIFSKLTLLLSLWLVVQSVGVAGTLPIGRVSYIQGKASALAPDKGARDLTLGDSLFQEDSVTTLDQTKIRLTFVDNTHVILGEKSEMTLRDYRYLPQSAQHSSRIWISMAKGALKMVTGLIGKNKRADVQIQTVSATIGIRGTDFWVGLDEKQALGVMLLAGKLHIANPYGQVDMDQAGTGTDVKTPQSAPTSPVRWGDARVRKALHSVEILE